MNNNAVVKVRQTTVFKRNAYNVFIVECCHVDTVSVELSKVVTVYTARNNIVEDMPMKNILYKIPQNEI